MLKQKIIRYFQKQKWTTKRYNYVFHSNRFII